MENVLRTLSLKSDLEYLFSSISQTKFRLFFGSTVKLRKMDLRSFVISSVKFVRPFKDVFWKQENVETNKEFPWKKGQPDMNCSYVACQASCQGIGARIYGVRLFYLYTFPCFEKKALKYSIFFELSLCGIFSRGFARKIHLSQILLWSALSSVCLLASLTFQDKKCYFLRKTKYTKYLYQNFTWIYTQFII